MVPSCLKTMHVQNFFHKLEHATKHTRADYVVNEILVHVYAVVL